MDVPDQKRAKIFFENYQGDFYKLCVTFHCGTEFRTFEQVLCTGIEKIGIFSEKIGFSQFKKNHQNLHRHFLIKDVYGYDTYGM